MRYWLFKSEPETFSIDDLANCPRQTEPWNGVRNYQVRNMLRDEIKKKDLGFFYHSSCATPGIVGIIEVVKEGYPEPDSPPWYMVDVKLVMKFPRMITLEEIKRHPHLPTMIITRKGNRLSITPVTKQEWKVVMSFLI